MALLFFFPIFWMVLTSFKTEALAISIPPKLFFTPTLENYALIQERTDYALYAGTLSLCRCQQRCWPC